MNESIGEEQDWKNPRESEQADQDKYQSLWMDKIWGMRPSGKVKVR